MNENQLGKVAMLTFIGFVASTVLFVAATTWLFPTMPWLGWASKLTVSTFLALVVSAWTCVGVYRRFVREQPSYTSRKSRAQAAPDRQSTTLAIIFVLIVGGALSFAAYYLPAIRSQTILAICLLVGIPLILRLVRGSLRDAETKSISQMDRPIMVSDRSRSKLGRGEAVRRETRKHPVKLVPLIPAMALVLMGTRYLGTYVNDARIPGGFLAIGVVIVVWKAISWHQDVLCITKMRIIEVSGVIATKAAAMPVKKMTDTTFAIPWHSHVLAGLRIIRLPYGSFVLESAGQNQALTEVHFVPEATAVNKMVVEDSFV